MSSDAWILGSISSSNSLPRIEVEGFDFIENVSGISDRETFLFFENIRKNGWKYAYECAKSSCLKEYRLLVFEKLGEDVFQSLVVIVENSDLLFKRV